MKKSKLIIIASLVIIASAALYGWKEYSRGHVTTAAIKPAGEKAAPDLVAAFEADEIKANELYNDKVILVTGKVQKVGIENNIVSISLTGNSAMSGVLCQFEKTEAEKLRDIKPGDMVSIKGICTGYLMDVILTRCVLNN